MNKELKGLACLKSHRWWDAAGTRALKTFAQAAVGAMVAESIWHIDIWVCFESILVPTIVSLLMSLAGLPEVDEAPK